ncbi:MAG: hypothetical protein J6Y02_03945 [Pseudobutyrivibrio sp.]|nr:hypothetical protein [Pseudobutyrivibrio sp.]
MIKKLIEEVTLQAEEVRDNLYRQDELRVQIQEKCIENWKKLILPVLQEYTQLFQYLTSCTRESVSLWARVYVTHDEQRYYGIKIDTTYYRSGLSIELLRSATHKEPITEDPYIEEDDQYNWDQYTNSSPEVFIEKVESDLFTVDIANYYYPLFINEDACNKVLTAITDVVACRLERLKNQLETKNSELVGIIDKLVAALAVAHSPVQKEDGTIEVMLGGKKFIGKLQEEEK